MVLSGLFINWKYYYKSLRNVDDIKKDLNENCCVNISFSIYSDFINY